MATISRVVAVPAVLALLLLAGCSAGAMPATVPDEPVVEQVEAADIETIDDGIAWARSLDNTATAAELSEGITSIGDLVPDLDIWFQTSNEIGQALVRLNIDVLDDPDTAGSKVDDLNEIVDDIEAAIEKGPKP